MPVFSRELGIDLGTMNTVIAEGNQILLEEPTVVAIVMEEQKIVEWGRAAKDMVGRVPESIEVVQPLQHGVIAEYEVTERMLQYLIKRLTGSMLFFRPRVMITVPYGVTSVESRAVHEAGLGSGSREVYLIRQPLAAALGVDLPIGTPLIGQPTAEQIKIQIGAAISLENPLSLEIQGQDRVTGLPRPITLATDDIVEALEEPLAELVQLVKRVLEKTPPELISDIIDRGVALCGGGALLRGVEKYLTKSLGIPAYLVDHPTTCTAQGAARALGMREALRRSLIRV